MIHIRYYLLFIIRYYTRAEAESGKRLQELQCEDLSCSPCTLRTSEKLPQSSGIHLLSIYLSGRSRHICMRRYRWEYQAFLAVVMVQGNMSLFSSHYHPESKKLSKSLINTFLVAWGSDWVVGEEMIAIPSDINICRSSRKSKSCFLRKRLGINPIL